jgi:hypothetical protein
MLWRVEYEIWQNGAHQSEVAFVACAEQAAIEPTLRHEANRDVLIQAIRLVGMNGSMHASDGPGDRMWRAR